MPAVDVNKDYYGLLGLQRPGWSTFVPVTEVRTAYYRLAKELHPDKTGGDVEGEEKFKLVLEAYQVLSDDALRKEYEQKRALLEPFSKVNLTTPNRPSERPPFYSPPAPFPFSFPTSKPPQPPPPPPPPPHEYQFQLPNQRTPDLDPSFDFKIFPTQRYFKIAANSLRPTDYITRLRKQLNTNRDERRKAQLLLNVAHVDLSREPPYLRTARTEALERQMLEQRAWAVWWETEGVRVEKWIGGHVIRARQCKEEWKREVREREAKRERERERVKTMARGGRVEVLEIGDSDDDGDEF